MSGFHSSSSNVKLLRDIRAELRKLSKLNYPTKDTQEEILTVIREITER